MKKSFAFLSFLFITQIATADIVCNTNIDKYFAVYEPYSFDCSSGYYLPANTYGCRPCLYGRYCAGGTYTFNTDNDQGIIIVSHVCNSGYFLPANADKCKPCPSGFTCPGGTFQFNPDEYQGLYLTGAITQTINNVCAANFPTYITAIYEPNKHNCATGFYMPANMDGCVECPENNYCAGGTYTFNKTVTQGITPCPDSDPYAPMGMWLESQCGRKLHVASEYLYLHKSPAMPNEHRLYARIGDDIYSVNATPVSENPNLKMSANAQRSLHVKIDGVEYLVHDDSVKLNP